MDREGGRHQNPVATQACILVRFSSVVSVDVYLLGLYVWLFGCVAFGYHYKCNRLPCRGAYQDLHSFLPRCMKCRRGIAMRILSVCLSVCPSVYHTRGL